MKLISNKPLRSYFADYFIGHFFRHFSWSLLSGLRSAFASPRFFVMAALLICAVAQAKTNAYDLKLDLSVKGKPLPSSKLTVKEGEQTSITQSTSSDKTFVDVIAVDDSPGNSIIKVKFVMGTILPSGERKVLTSDEILANENQPAKVSLSTSKGEDDFSFVVTAKRKAQ